MSWLGITVFALSLSSPSLSCAAWAQGVSGGDLLSLPNVVMNSTSQCDVDIRPVSLSPLPPSLPTSLPLPPPPSLSLSLLLPCFRLSTVMWWLSGATLCCQAFQRGSTENCLTRHLM